MSRASASSRHRFTATTANWRPLVVEASLIVIVFAAIVTAALVGTDAGGSADRGTQGDLQSAGVFFAADEQKPAN